jgi:curved DNA-binding protein CbpA
MRKDPYEVLGVPADSDDETIKRAFRTLVREHHPDVSPSPEAELRFRELVEAYQRLVTPQRRFAPRRETPLDLSGIVSFYAWLASKRAQARADEAVRIVELELRPGEAIRGGVHVFDVNGRRLTVDVPPGAEEGEQLTAVAEDGTPVPIVVLIRRRLGTGWVVQAASVLGIAWAIGLLALVLTR